MLSAGCCIGVPTTQEHTLHISAFFWLHVFSAFIKPKAHFSPGWEPIRQHVKASALHC